MADAGIPAICRFSRTLQVVDNNRQTVKLLHGLVVESNGLLTRRRGITATAGSNPALSAIFLFVIKHLQNS